jgi:outer membrane receptor protein involved in Fe transport
MTTLGYAGNALTAGLRWRFLGAMDDVTSVTTPATPLPGTSNYSTYDLFANYNLTERIQIRAGVTNFTDELSVQVSSSQNSQTAWQRIWADGTTLLTLSSARDRPCSVPSQKQARRWGRS